MMKAKMKKVKRSDFLKFKESNIDWVKAARNVRISMA